MAEFFVSCAIGTEKALENEIQDFWPYLIDKNSRPHAVPLKILEIDSGGILLDAPEFIGLQINFFSKIANRVLMRLSTFKSKDFTSLELGLKKIDLKPFQSSVPFEFSIAASKSRMNNEKRIAESAAKVWKLKPADTGQKIFLRMFDDRLTVSIDTSGEHLHKRGGRDLTGLAPLRETLAAFILQQLIFKTSAAELSTIELVDPMTGSGTFLSEALNLYRPQSRKFAFQDWKSCPPILKSDDLLKNYRIQKTTFGQVLGFESDLETVKIAKKNIPAIEQADLFTQESLPLKRRWVVVNPPYGERLALHFTPERLLTALDRVYSPERVAILWTQEMSKKLPKQTSSGLKIIQTIPVLNGGLKCAVNLYHRG